MWCVVGRGAQYVELAHYCRHKVEATSIFLYSQSLAVPRVHRHLLAFLFHRSVSFLCLSLHFPKKQPDNLLIFENGSLRICDFGSARFVKISRRPVNTDDSVRGEGCGYAEEDEEGLTNSVGTYTFHCPESVRGDGAPYSGRAADAWAAACTLYCWIFGWLPFHAESLEKLFDKIKREEVDVGEAISPELASLLKGMLHKNPAQRIGLQAVLDHPWMRSVPDPPPPAGFDPNA